MKRMLKTYTGNVFIGMGCLGTMLAGMICDSVDLSVFGAIMIPSLGAMLLGSAINYLGGIR